MPPIPKLSQEQLVSAAIEVIRENGIEYLNARNIANKLHMSTTPIFRLFDTIEELKAAAYAKAEEIYTTYLFQKSDPHIKSDFLQIGINYIRFAYNERNLYKFIFLSNNLTLHSFQSVADMADMPEILNSITSTTGLSLEKAKLLFTSIWSMTHGLSCIIATNEYAMNETELIEMLELAYKGILSELKETT